MAGEVTATDDQFIKAHNVKDSNYRIIKTAGASTQSCSHEGLFFFLSHPACPADAPSASRLVLSVGSLFPLRKVVLTYIQHHYEKD